MALWNGAIFLATLCLVYYVPGRLVVAWLDEAPAPEESFSLSLGLGLVIVNTLAVLGVGLAGLFTPTFLSAWMLWGLAAGTSLVAGLLLWRRRQTTITTLMTLIARPTRTQALLLGLTLLATGFYLLHYDTDRIREDACNLRLSTNIAADVWQPELIAANKAYVNYGPFQFDSAGEVQVEEDTAFLTGWDGQRLGPSVLLAPFSVLFGSFGYRLVYALQGLLLPGLGFLLGWRLLGRRDAAWAVAFLLTFSPYAIDARIFDENHIANIFGALTLVLLLRRVPAATLAGISCSLFLGTRHVGAVALPFALAFLLTVRPTPRRAVVRFLTALAVFSAPYVIMHVLVMLLHDGSWFESAMERAPAPHSFFGLDFHSTTLWNYPLVPEPLRAPYHALPTLVLIPLDFARRFGALLIGLVPAGFAHLWRRSPARAWLLAGWLMPLVGLVMIQSNWIEESKLGVPATALAPLVVLIIAGAVSLVDAARSRASRFAWALGGLLPVLIGVPLLQAWEAPRDERIFAYTEEWLEPSLLGDLVVRADETQAYVDWDRQRYGLRLLPRLRPDHEWSTQVLRRDAGRLRANLERPWFRDYERPVPDFIRQILETYYVGINPLSLRRLAESGSLVQGLAPVPLASRGDFAPRSDEALVPVTLDLRTPSLLAEAPIQAADGMDPVAIRVDGSALIEVGPFDLPWDGGQGETLLVARESGGPVYLFLTPGRPLEERYPQWLAREHVPATRFPEQRVTLLVPRGEVIRLFEFRSFQPPRWYSRFLVVDEDGVWLSAAVPLSPA